MCFLENRFVYESVEEEVLKTWGIKEEGDKCRRVWHVVVV